MNMGFSHPVAESCRRHTHFCRTAWLFMLVAWGVAVMVCPMRASADPPRWRIIVIAPPPEALDFEYFPEPYMSINNRGEVVSTVYENGVNYPFVWLPAANANYDDGLGLGAGTHSLPTPANDFQARKINSNGLLVGRGSVPNFGLPRICEN